MTTTKILVDLEDVEMIVDWWRSANKSPGGCSTLEAINGMRDAVWGLETSRRLQLSMVLTPPPPPGLPAPSGSPERLCMPCYKLGDLVAATFVGIDGFPTCDYHADNPWTQRNPNNTKDSQ